MVEVAAPPKQLCRRCNGELAYDEKRNCKYCPFCYPPNRIQQKPITEKKKYLDVKLTEVRAREIAEECVRELVPDMIRVELENWYIQKPSVTKDEINELTNNAPAEPKIIEETYLQKAKRLGIATHYPDGGGIRKKADVMTDIAAKESKDEEL